MKLFQSEDGMTVSIAPEAYTIKQFAELIESRKGDVTLIHKELAYVYFFADMSSDFQFQTNTKDRHYDLIKYLGLPSDWVKDKYVEEAIEAYEYLSQTASSRLLQSAYVVADKIKAQLESINLNERDKGGKPVWNIKQIQDVLKSLPSSMESIDQAEKKFIRSQVETGKLKGNRQKSMYDGIKLGK